MRAHGSERRDFLKWLGAAAVTSACDRRASPSDAGVVSGFPEKASNLTLLTDRPPNLETPLHYFRHDLTPNDAFFVRWHLSGLPTRIDTRAFRLKIAGHVERPLELTLDAVRALEPTSIVAVNQCSGNSRSTFSPRVPGVQWTHGALGNARWKGVRLKALLETAGVKAGAVEVSFAGMDKPPLASVPEFVKSLELARATEDDVLVAYEMNGAPLPMLNGFPLRLVVPGWYSTYWIKALDRITVLPAAFDGYWMKKAYRIPKAPGAAESPDALAAETVPISRMNVRSLIVRPEPDEAVPIAKPYEVEGIAFDGGSGIAKVEVSTDGGASWTDARLDADLGKYSFRRWRAAWTPTGAGPQAILSRATSAAGETQTSAPIWNRGGYMRNVVETVSVKVVS